MITARLGLRARLYLASASILMLFAFNVATHLWGSYARSESVMAYRIATEAAGLVRGIQQGLATEHQRVRSPAPKRSTPTRNRNSEAFVVRISVNIRTNVIVIELTKAMIVMRSVS